jgi:hypothetical protein
VRTADMEYPVVETADVSVTDLSKMAEIAATQED